MEKKGLLKLPFDIILFEIPKYLEIKDYLNYASTCKYIRNNFERSEIWERELKKNYTEEERLFVQNETSTFNKYKKLVTQTINYHKCNVAHGDTYWSENDGGLMLRNVCWLHIIGKLNNVPDGRYVPEFIVKFNRRSQSLDRLEFRARVIEKEIEDEEKEDYISKEQEQTTQPRDGEEPTESVEVNTNDNNNNNSNRLSFYNMALSLLTLGLYKGNNTESNNNSSPNRNVNNDNDNNKKNKKTYYSREIMSSEFIFNRNILKVYRNNEWRIVECPEIKVNHSVIDQNKSRIMVELEIKDISSYWKTGITFKGIRLRNVVSTENESDISNSESEE